MRSPLMLVFFNSKMSDPDIFRYEEYYQRFRKIFRASLADPLPMYFLPGNHDIGYAGRARFYLLISLICQIASELLLDSLIVRWRVMHLISVP